MHEFSLMQTIVDDALETAKKEHASKIKSITIENGALSHLSRENIEFWWQTLTKDTLAQDAKIIYIEKPARIHCIDCDQIIEIKNTKANIDEHEHAHDDAELLIITCPHCNSRNTEVFEGLETNVLELELELENLVIE